MSTNLKSGNAIVRLLLAHGEKLGILAILVCTGLIVWKAVGRDRLDKEPAQLTNLAKETDNQLENSSWATLREQSLESVVIAEPLPDTAMAKVSADHFPPFQSSFNPPVSDPVTLRMDPEILAVADLEVNSDSGLWASANPEMIRQKMLDAEKERLQEEREREAERERAGRDGRGRRGGGGPGGYGAEGGGYGGAGGRLGGRNDKPARDAPIVQRSREGAQLQGFEEIQAKSWVTILGRLPIKKQYNIYADALATSRGYNRAVDKPNYLAYEVQRAEITSKGQGEWERIKINNKARLEKEMATYPVNVADVIDTKVNHPFLTHPLPPLILQEWGERVSHSSMPLAAEIALQKMEEMKNPEDEEEDEKPAGEPAGEDDLFADVVTRREKMKQGGRTAAAGGYGGEFGGYGGEGGGYGRGAGGYGGGYGGEFGGEGGYGGEFGGEGGYGGGYGGEFGGGGYGGMRGTMGQGSGVELAEFVLDQETEDVLFRYFDNTAQPGRSYRYRVRLALADVNHGVEEQHLDKSVTLRREETGKKKYRWTEWSEPSPVASVPLPARIYLVKTDPVKEDSYTSEPEADILIKALNSEFAAEVARTEEFSRGSVINIVDKAKVIWAGKIDQVQFPSFEFLTGITVLDCAGGEKLGRDMLAPSRVLLMDAAGHLFVQDEMDDLEEVEEYEAVIEQEDSTRGRGGRGGPEGGYGGGYGGEFGGEGGYGGY